MIKSIVLTVCLLLGTAASADTELYVEVDEQIAVKIQSTDEPVIVENIRVRPKGSLTTEHQRVVRQGDKVLLIVRPYRNSGGIVHD